MLRRKVFSKEEKDRSAVGVVTAKCKFFFVKITFIYTRAIVLKLVAFLFGLF